MAIGYVRGRKLARARRGREAVVEAVVALPQGAQGDEEVVARGPLGEELTTVGVFAATAQSLELTGLLEEPVLRLELVDAPGA